MLIIFALSAFLMIGYQTTEAPANKPKLECFKDHKCGQHRPKIKHRRHKR